LTDEQKKSARKMVLQSFRTRVRQPHKKTSPRWLEGIIKYALQSGLSIEDVRAQMIHVQPTDDMSWERYRELQKMLDDFPQRSTTRQVTSV